MLLNAIGEEDVLECLYVSACAETRLHYEEYFYSICALCAIDGTNCSY